MAFTGIEHGMPFIHGSQGCSTYIRRYMIGHFREPVDIACSNFSESTVIFGGEQNFKIGLNNVIEQYQPKLIGIATTCLAETIGDDLNQFVFRYESTHPGDCPLLIPVSTPSYKGSHVEGFHRAVRAVVEKLSMPGSRRNHINLFAGMVSPEDIRHMKEIFTDFKLPFTILPDYSDSLDGGIWQQYEKNIDSGTSIADIQNLPSSLVSFEFGEAHDGSCSAADFLLHKFGTPNCRMPLPVGVNACDIFFEQLKKITNGTLPDKYLGQRSRLIDSYVDGHKYVFGKKAVIYGPVDLVVALASFLDEIGMIPALCGSDENTGNLHSLLHKAMGENFEKTIAVEGVDFIELENHAQALNIDMVIGNSNGYKMARKLEVPLLRVGLPIHDRIGAARIQTLGYSGTQQLFDRIVNEFIQLKQQQSTIGYTHI